MKHFLARRKEACAKFGFMLRRVLPALLCLLVALPSVAQTGGDDVVLQAREALRKRDKAALALARTASSNARHPLAMWVDYWELQNRLTEAQQPELDAFAQRWAGTYVEDRLRNDWLLELGRRRDWVNFRAEFPRFKMNDDREVTCFSLLTRHLEGQDVKVAARNAWFAQRDLDDGCNLLAKTLYDARILVADDAWHEMRLSIENSRPRATRAAAAFVSPAVADAVGALIDNPARFLGNRRGSESANGHELTLLALMRAAANDPEYAAGQLQDTTRPRLPMAIDATAWAHVAKQAALKQMPQAGDWAREAWKRWDAAHKAGQQPPWTDDLLAWHARAALREPVASPKRWTLLLRAIEAMPAGEQRETGWAYWKARGLQAQAAAGPEGDAARDSARALLETTAVQPGFYGLLAAEALGNPLALPTPPAPLTQAERDMPRGIAGFQRALQLVALSLRNEGVREWNFTLRGLVDRELLAAAQWACEREVWDRCINTSERTRGEIDMAQRYPTPYREQIQARARESGIDTAVLLGLIRQESRFVADARSSVGASGLMQLMPATARWTAKKAGIDYRGENITDPAVNLQLGSAYLKRVLDDFGASLPMAAAAYNAGPGRPRKWREGGGTLEPAAWAESIPFNETRDYVKRVLANSVYYGALLGAQNPTLKARLGPAIGPREPGATVPDKDLP